VPLTPKGEKILAGMKQQYGAEKGESVFYASKNAGTISGVDAAVTRDQGGITSSFLPNRQNLIGNMPGEEGGYRSDRKSGEALAPTVAPQTGTIGNTIAGSRDEPKDRSIRPKVGDSDTDEQEETQDNVLGAATGAVEGATNVVHKVSNTAEQFNRDQMTSSIPQSTTPSAGMSQSSTAPVTTGDSKPVGDQSLQNWNSRNRTFWKV
jgi:hypothetical protein